MEVLSRLLQLKTNQKLVNGIPIFRNNTPISHRFFASDAFIFYRENMGEALEIMNTLQTFSELSGQLINCKKLGVLFSKNTHLSINSRIIKTKNIREIHENERYLGTPLFFGQNKKNKCSNFFSGKWKIEFKDGNPKSYPRLEEWFSSTLWYLQYLIIRW